MVNIKEYQEWAKTTATYKDEHKIIYPALGLAGEAGEVAEKIKKLLRDDAYDKEAITLELGDVIWYVVTLASDLDIEIEDVLVKNMIKLNGRLERNTIHGNGDNR